MATSIGQCTDKKWEKRLRFAEWDERLSLWASVHSDAYESLGEGLDGCYHAACHTDPGDDLEAQAFEDPMYFGPLGASDPLVLRF